MCAAGLQTGKWPAAERAGYGLFWYVKKIETGHQPGHQQDTDRTPTGPSRTHPPWFEPGLSQACGLGCRPPPETLECDPCPNQPAGTLTLTSFNVCPFQRSPRAQHTYTTPPTSPTRSQTGCKNIGERAAEWESTLLSNLLIQGHSFDTAVHPISLPLMLSTLTTKAHQRFGSPRLVVLTLGAPTLV